MHMGSGSPGTAQSFEKQVGAVLLDRAGTRQWKRGTHVYQLYRRIQIHDHVQNIFYKAWNAAPEGAAGGPCGVWKKWKGSTDSYRLMASTINFILRLFSLTGPKCFRRQTFVS